MSRSSGMPRMGLLLQGQFEHLIRAFNEVRFQLAANLFRNILSIVLLVLIRQNQRLNPGAMRSQYVSTVPRASGSMKIWDR